jgi:hypothetical protein
MAVEGCFALAPDLNHADVTLCPPDQLARRAVEPDAALVEHDQAIADRFHVLDDMGRQDHEPAAGVAREQVPKANALLRVQPTVGSSTISSSGH